MQTLLTHGLIRGKIKGMGSKVFLGASLDASTMAKLDQLAALTGTNRSAALRALLDAPLTTLALLISLSSEGQKETAVLRQTGRAAALRATMEAATSHDQLDFTTPNI